MATGFNLGGLFNATLELLLGDDATPKLLFGDGGGDARTTPTSSILSESSFINSSKALSVTSNLGANIPKVDGLKRFRGVFFLAMVGALVSALLLLSIVVGRGGSLMISVLSPIPLPVVSYRFQ